MAHTFAIAMSYLRNTCYSMLQLLPITEDMMVGFSNLFKTNESHLKSRMVVLSNHNYIEEERLEFD